LLGPCRFIFASRLLFGLTSPELIGDVLRELAPILLLAVAGGQIRPVIDSRFAVQDAPGASLAARSS
jgi:hypothetical protein